MILPLVIAGLDPAIHTKGQRALRFIMDARVKPAHDEVCFLRGRAKTLLRHGRACPGIHAFTGGSTVNTWMPGTRPGMTSMT